MSQPSDPSIPAPQEQWPSEEEVTSKWDRLCADRGCNSFTCSKLKETFRTLDDFEYLAEKDIDELLPRWGWEARAG